MQNLSQPVIKTDRLSKSYGNIEALKDLTLTIPSNQIVGFLGPNGAGKSTAIKILLGLTQPTSGGGEIFGLDIVKENPQIRRRVGYLAQNPNFYNYMTCREILNYTAHFFFEGPQNKIDQRIDETLELVGLTDKADRPIRGFSGGERQRLGIAQAQINYPDLLILDEPAAALDPMGRRDVLEVMERLRKHTTIFFSTHILDDVQRVSDQVVILNHGKMVAQGRVEDLLNAKEGVVFQIVFKGNVDQTQQRLENITWVQNVRKGTQNHGYHKLMVNVLDQTLAEKELLRAVLSDENVQVSEFQRLKLNLEDVFLQLVEGENHVG
ncbi:MAG: multidrug ABC transporter ATP-binding protein [Anaerolineaceae bacterium]|nr:multidrug ABC transporter ATP-binding protein [Anaerolineaceae bacterium]